MLFFVLSLRLVSLLLVYQRFHDFNDVQYVFFEILYAEHVCKVQRNFLYNSLLWWLVYVRVGGEGREWGGQSEGQLRYWVSVCGQVGHITLCIHVSEDRWQRIGLQLCGWEWWINGCLMWHTPEADRPGRLERTATHRVGVAVSNICTSPSCLWLTYRQQEQE